MKYEIIGSSSKGNCIIVEDVLMLDCGVTYVKIKKYLPKVKLIFISHDHLDHLLPTTIKKIIFNFPKIKFVTGSVEVVKILNKIGAYNKNIYILDWGKKYNLGLLKVKLVYLYHDTPNYGLKWALNGKSFA